MITPAIEQSPTSLVDTLCEKAEALLKQNNIDGVEALASEASARDPACNRAHQLMVRVALIRGEQDRAQTLLNRWRDLPVDDAFVEWGVLAEEMNDIQSAVEIYQAHLSQHPHNARASFGLAILHAERNENGLAQSRLQTLIQHHADHIEGIFELARLYEEDGMMGLAQELYARVLNLDPDHAGARAGKQLVGAQLQSSQTLPDATLKNHPDIAALILRLFAARKDVYARQWIDEDGKTGYVPVREPLTENAIQSHLRGDTTIGVYPIFDRNKAQFLALDIDIKKEALNRARQNNTLMDALRAQVCKDIRRVCAGFASLNIPVHIEDSGNKGAHIWLFFEKPIPACDLRAFGRAYIKRFGPASEELQWELFPKQDAVGEDELGNLIKLPLGIHRKTGRRALFIDTEGHTLADQDRVLRDIKPINTQAFTHAVSRLGGGETHTPLKEVDLQKAFPEFQPILKGCAVIRALTEKAFATAHLVHIERHVLKCVFGHLDDRGRAFLHTVIGACADYKTEVTDYQIDRLHPHPIGCPKIRKHLPELVETVPCNCEFDLPEGGYPSPLLHIDPAFTAGMGRVDQPQNRETVDRYVTLRQQAAKVMADLSRVEDEMRDLLRDRKGKISTGVWVVTADDTGRLQIGVEAV